MFLIREIHPFAPSLCHSQEIAPFLAEYADVINVAEIDGDVATDFPTFNRFFYRKLKAGTRPVAEPAQPEVVVSGADCRLMVRGGRGVGAGAGAPSQQGSM